MQLDYSRYTPPLDTYEVRDTYVCKYTITHIHLYTYNNIDNNTTIYARAYFLLHTHSALFIRNPCYTHI